MLDDVCATLHAQSEGADEKFLEVVMDNNFSCICVYTAIPCVLLLYTIISIISVVISCSFALREFSFVPYFLAPAFIVFVNQCNQLQSTPLNRATSGPGCFDPIKRRNILTENIVSQTVILSYKSCEILTRLSGEIY